MMGQAYDIKYVDTTEKAYDTKHVHAIGWAYSAEPHNDNVVVTVVVVVVVVVETNKLDENVCLFVFLALQPIVVVFSTAR